MSQEREWKPGWKPVRLTNTHPIQWLRGVKGGWYRTRDPFGHPRYHVGGAFDCPTCFRDESGDKVVVARTIFFEPPKALVVGCVEMFLDFQWSKPTSTAEGSVTFRISKRAVSFHKLGGLVEGFAPMTPQELDDLSVRRGDR